MSVPREPIPHRRTAVAVTALLAAAVATVVVVVATRGGGGGGTSGSTAASVPTVTEPLPPDVPPLDGYWCADDSTDLQPRSP